MERHDVEKRQVVITADDVKNVNDFFTHFKIEMPVNLRSSIDTFTKDPTSFTFEDQCKLRAFLAHAVTSVDHVLLKDQVFATIRAKCEKTWFEANFDMDLEKVLTEPK